MFFSFFAAVVLLFAGYFAYRLIPAETCTDGKQNQDETGVDCGGSSCQLCLTEQAKDLVIVWTRYFEVRPGVYDVAALVENVNISIGIKDLPYEFRLYGDENAYLASRRGQTYSLPNQQFLIFEPNVQTGSFPPRRMTFEMDEFSWQRADEQSLPISIARTERLLTLPRPKLTVTLSNSSIRDVPRVDVMVIVSEASGNAVGVSASRLPIVPDTSSADAVFTWPMPFTGTPDDVTILVRKNPWEAS